MSVSKQHSKIFDSRNLQSWVNCEIQFELTTGERLIGKLKSLDPKYNVFHFKNLRKLNGTPWCIEQNYSYRDFQGKFICITQNVSIDINDDFKVRQAAEALLLRLEDKSETLEVIENAEDFDTSDDFNPVTLDIPSAAECEFEARDFDFNLDPEVFEGLSNDVVRIDPRDADKVAEAVAILESSSIVGFTCLPWTEERDIPIDFAIFGCEKGTFIFPFIHDVWEKLKATLESEDVCKVAHDCSVMAARLHLLYHIGLNNVDDTLVWDCMLIKRDYPKLASKQTIHSYHDCVKIYLKIDLPWPDTENFYEKCGKGKLLTKPLDETGASYARSLVMLYFEMRTEMLKHLFYPTLRAQFNYLNNVKYMSAHEYVSLKSANRFSPYFLIGSEAGENEVNFSGIQSVSDILREKYKFFNVVHSRKTKVQGLQCTLETQTEARPNNVRRLKRNKRLASNDSACSSLISGNSYDMSQPGSSRSVPFSSNSSSLGQSPESPHSKNDTHVSNGSSSSAINVNHGVTNHGKIPDWSMIANQAPDRPVIGRIYPAGCSF